jgi:hypothetical protein
MDICFLHPAPETRPNTRSFCGPTAIASATGLTIEEVERAVLKHRETNPPPIKHRRRGVVIASMWEQEFVPVLKLLGFRATKTHSHEWNGKPTLEAFAYRSNASSAADLPCVVIVTRHAIAMHRRFVVDSGNRQPVHISKLRRLLRKRVLLCWTVQKEATP